MCARSDQRRAAKGGSGQRAQLLKRQKGAGLRLCSSHVLHHKETSNLIGAQVCKRGAGPEGVEGPDARFVASRSSQVGELALVEPGAHEGRVG